MCTTRAHVKCACVFFLCVKSFLFKIKNRIILPQNIKKKFFNLGQKAAPRRSSKKEKKGMTRKWGGSSSSVGGKGALPAKKRRAARFLSFCVFLVAFVAMVVFAFSSFVQVEVVSNSSSSSSSSDDDSVVVSSGGEEKTTTRVEVRTVQLPCKNEGKGAASTTTTTTTRENLCEDPSRVDVLIRSHSCETGTNAEEFQQAELKAMPRKPSEENSNDDNNNNDDSRKRRRDVLNHVEDVDPEMENQEMNRVLERFRSGQMVLEGRRNIFHDDGGDGNGNGAVKTYKTCALVGNSGTLQKTAYGAMIDSAEAVFRVNDGVAKRGCSLYAGSRTTVRVVDAKALGKMEILADDEEEGTKTSTNSFRSSSSSSSGNETMVVLVNADEHERETIANSEYFNHAKSVKRVHEDVQDGANVLMHSYREHLAKIGKMQGAGGNIPSTGMVAFYLALRLCDFVALYGFGLYVEKERVENATPSSGKKKGVAPVTAVHDFYRYYDARRNVELGMRQTHSFDTERMLMSLVSRSTGRSKLCGFKKDGDEDEVTKRIRREQDRRARQLARRTGRGKVKGGSNSNNNANGASSDSASGVSVAEEKPIEHNVNWDAHFDSSTGAIPQQK